MFGCSTTNQSPIVNGLPRNPDPNKCYVRSISVDISEKAEYKSLTYTREEAKLYFHEMRLLETTPEISRWEFQTLEDCQSEDPDECQVLCYKKYAAVYDTFYYPADSTKGNPFVRTTTYDRLKQVGGRTTYVEVDCSLISFSALPIDFAHLSTTLSPEDVKVVEKRIVKILLEKPALRIEINAHTDARGDAASNQKLSESRLKKVVKILSLNGITRDRIVARGMGESRLKNHCADGVDCTEKEHAVNNRIEWRVMNQEI